MNSTFLRTMDRRRFLKASALSAGALALGELGSLPAHATVPTTKFDVSDPFSYTTQFSKKALDYRSGFQSFGFDPYRSLVFYAQPCPATDGGITVAKQRGEFRIATLNYSGNPPDSGYMQFTGFGHGGTMGIQYTENNTYIWIETDAEVRPDGNKYGKRICRLKYRGNNHGPFDYSDVGDSTHPNTALAGSDHFMLKPGSHENSVNYCQASNRILLRYYWDGDSSHVAGYYFAVFQGNDVANHVAGATTPIVDWIPQASILTSYEAAHFQSFALYGNYGYIVAGPKSDDCPQAAPGRDARLVRFKCNPTSLDLQRQSHLPPLAPALNYREPEGAAIWIYNGSPRLCWGMKSDIDCSAAATEEQRGSIYYTDNLVAG